MNKLNCVLLGFKLIDLLRDFLSSENCKVNGKKWVINQVQGHNKRIQNGPWII